MRASPQALDGLPGATIAVLTDGLAANGRRGGLRRRCSAQSPANVVWAAPDRLDMVGLTAADNEVDRFAITAMRAAGRRRRHAS